MSVYPTAEKTATKSSRMPEGLAENDMSGLITSRVTPVIESTIPVTICQPGFLFRNTTPPMATKSGMVAIITDEMSDDTSRIP